MSIKKEFSFPSACKTTSIHALSYIPDVPVKGILQITHGMVEYIERYEEFANYLTSYGFLVTGHDHLGHGASVNSPEEWGYFCEKKGNEVLLEDIHQLMLITQKEYPHVPYFLLGHSMGSFYARQYLCSHGDMLQGAIIMGTGFQPPFLVVSGMLLCRLIALFKGWKYRCTFVNNMAFGSYNKKFQPARTDKDWLSKDVTKVDEYVAEPRCNFTFTLNAYYHMFSGISSLYKKKLLKRIPKDLPVFFVSGKEDPVGDFSKGVIAAANSLKAVGMKNISVKLYENDRHEILNETDRETVYEDLLLWLTKYSSKR